MAKFCPIRNSKVTYLVCQECEERECESDSFRRKEKGKEQEILRKKERKRKREEW